ncbi:hypothetical protein Syun_031485 [Stephania yunnanensis]|uniref:Uncharacterized protein n=1 Tax=Stephania yunnanensis TaxID=152371 RepID=A0AAP0DW44_9MAGN
MKRKGEEEEDDDDMVWLDESFFINDDYKMSTFSFGSQVIHLLCLQSASIDDAIATPWLYVVSSPTICCAADYDLTGQLVWPGAVLLNNYLSNNTAILQGCSIIELGSGVAVQMFKSFLVVEGVTGILCSRFCHEILLTDHNEQILKKNIELQPSHENHTNHAAEKLEWGNSSFVERLLRHRGAAGSKFILAYVSRAKTMDVMVLNEAAKHGLQVREVEGTRSVVSNLEGKVKDPIVVLPIHDKLDLENLLGNAFQELSVLVSAYVRTLFGTEGQITSAEENIDHGQDMKIEDERFSEMCC